MKDKFDSLPNSVRQTGVITHIPATGIPLEEKSPSASRDEIEEQMKKVLDSAHNCSHEEVYNGPALDMPTIEESCKIPRPAKKGPCYNVIQLDGSMDQADGSSEDGTENEDMEEGEVKSSSEVEFITEVINEDHRLADKKRKISVASFDRDRKKYKKRKRKSNRISSSSSDEYDDDKCVDPEITPTTHNRYCSSFLKLMLILGARWCFTSVWLYMILPSNSIFVVGTKVCLFSAF